MRGRLTFDGVVLVAAAGFVCLWMISMLLWPIR
jgi:hypothetical protein